MTNLTEICANLKNYFLRGDEDRKTGTFTITSGTAPLDSLLEGQYFAIFDSVLNNGVWQNTAEDLVNLRNETFTGQIWSMSVPRDFEQLCEDIAELNAQIEEISALWRGFDSESWNGYTYKLGTSVPYALLHKQQRIISRLNTYRRLFL